MRGNWLTALAVLVAGLWLAGVARAAGMPDIETVGGMREACRYYLGQGDGKAEGLLLAFNCEAHMSTVARPPGYDTAEKRPTAFCVPDSVPVPELAAAFVRWSDSREERWMDDAKAGAIDAFAEAWPCK